jgi:hypothetical protein
MRDLKVIISSSSRIGVLFTVFNAYIKLGILTALIVLDIGLVNSSSLFKLIKETDGLTKS